MVDEPNQGATGEAPTETVGPGTTGDVEPAGAGQEDAGAYGETPLGVATESDSFAERPELFVGAAFAGGLALAMILRRLAR
jgi:hypothetical protein